jgi:hypothetical protein
MRLMPKKEPRNHPRGIDEWIENIESKFVVGIYPRRKGKTTAVLQRAASNIGETIVLVPGQTSARIFEIELEKLNVRGKVKVLPLAASELVGHRADCIIMDDLEYISRASFKEVVNLITECIKPQQLLLIGTLRNTRAKVKGKLEGPDYTPRFSTIPESNLLWFIEKFANEDMDVLGLEPFEESVPYYYGTEAEVTVRTVPRIVDENPVNTKEIQNNIGVLIKDLGDMILKDTKWQVSRVYVSLSRRDEEDDPTI